MGSRQREMELQPGNAILLMQVCLLQQTMALAVILSNCYGISQMEENSGSQEEADELQRKRL